MHSSFARLALGVALLAASFPALTAQAQMPPTPAYAWPLLSERAGAEVWVESEETAVVFGMPQAAIANGPVTRVLALSLLGPQLAQAIQVSRGSGNFPALKPKK